MYRLFGRSGTLWDGIPMKFRPSPYILTRAHTQTRAVYINNITFNYIINNIFSKYKYAYIKGIIVFKGYINFIYKWIYKAIGITYSISTSIMYLNSLNTNISTIKALIIKWRMY